MASATTSACSAGCNVDEIGAPRRLVFSVIINEDSAQLATCVGNLPRGEGREGRHVDGVGDASDVEEVPRAAASGTTTHRPRHVKDGRVGVASSVIVGVSVRCGEEAEAALHRGVDLGCDVVVFAKQELGLERVVNIETTQGEAFGTHVLSEHVDDRRISGQVVDGFETLTVFHERAGLGLEKFGDDLVGPSQHERRALPCIDGIDIDALVEFAPHANDVAPRGGSKQLISTERPGHFQEGVEWQALDCAAVVELGASRQSIKGVPHATSAVPRQHLGCVEAIARIVGQVWRERSSLFDTFDIDHSRIPEHLRSTNTPNQKPPHILSRWRQRMPSDGDSSSEDDEEGVEESKHSDWLDEKVAARIEIVKGDIERLVKILGVEDEYNLVTRPPEHVDPVRIAHAQQEAANKLAQALNSYADELEERAAAKQAIQDAHEAAGLPPPDFTTLNPAYVASLSGEEQEKIVWGLLDERVAAKAREHIEEFFPVQRGVLPVALRDASKPQEQMEPFRDLCVAAPTGSGKTLIYALTIWQALANRQLRILRAVVVAPTRELARQIRDQLERFKPTDIKPKLKVALSVGGSADDLFEMRPSLEFMEVSIACPVSTERPHPDVLVCTPGRLVDLIDEAPKNGFTLQHLRYLVVDEADRLVAQSYQGWAKKVLKASFIDTPYIPPIVALEELGEKFIAPVTRRSMSDTAGRQPRLQKLLFSATLTEDPKQLHTLQLVRPVYLWLDNERVKPIDEPEQQTYSLPATLRESIVLCDAATKPLCLLALLDDAQLIVVFASSVDTTTRLAALLRLWFESDDVVFELSSASRASVRDRTLDAIRQRRTAVLVATDAVSRGIDLTGVGLVVNYDAPNNARAYVHRVGRAARAGAQGSAVTLVKKGQERAFERVRADVDDARLPRRKIPRAKVDELTPKYRACLANLKDALKNRRRRPPEPMDVEEPPVVEEEEEVAPSVAAFRAEVERIIGHPIPEIPPGEEWTEPIPLLPLFDAPIEDHHRHQYCAACERQKRWDRLNK